jgi:hypothetical protein
VKLHSDGWSLEGNCSLVPPDRSVVIKWVTSMGPMYSFVADTDFYRTALARFRRQQPLWRRWAPWAAILIALITVYVYARATDAPWVLIPAVLAGGIVGGAAGGFAVRSWIMRRVRRMPGFGGTITVRLDEDGLHMTEPHGEMNLAWTAFNRVVRVNDGLLLMRGSSVRWLPDSALQNVTSDDALAFVRSRVPVVVVD